jgi:hypothetical protein
MKMVWASILFINAFIGQTAYASCIEIINKLPLNSQSQTTQASFVYQDGTIFSQFACSGSTMEITRTTNSFQAQLTIGECKDGTQFNPIWTATVYFEGNNAYYLDFDSKKHALEAVCSNSGVVLNLKNSPADRTNPWRPAPQQWTFKLDGKNRVLFDYKYFSADPYLHFQSTLQ